MGITFKTLVSFLKFNRNQKSFSGVPLVLMLFLVSLLFMQSGFAADAYGANLTDIIYKNCTTFIKKKVKIKEVTRIVDSTKPDTKFCPILSHPETVTANKTSTSICDEIGKDKISILEPSGLTYDSINNIWIGVSDNYNDFKKCKMGEYAVFYFDKIDKAQLKEVHYKDKKGNTKSVHLWMITVKPLLTTADAEKIRPNDLEGIEFDGSSTFYMTGSLGKHASNPKRDTWHRYKVYQFKVQKNGSNYEAIDIKNPFSNWGWNLRDWLIFDQNIKWHHLQKTCSSTNLQSCLTNGIATAWTGRSETGDGINIESLALASNTAGSNLILIFGMRGPIFGHESGGSTGANLEIHASFLKIESVNSTPQFKNQQYIKTDHTTLKDSKGFGLRGMTLITHSNIKEEIYAVIMGATDGAHDILKAGLIKADSISGIFSWTAPPKDLPGGFVGEGISVRKITKNSDGTFTIDAHIVSDLNAYFMEIEFTYTP